MQLLRRRGSRKDRKRSNCATLSTLSQKSKSKHQLDDLSRPDETPELVHKNLTTNISLFPSCPASQRLKSSRSNKSSIKGDLLGDSNKHSKISFADVQPTMPPKVILEDDCTPQQSKHESVDDMTITDTSAEVPRDNTSLRHGPVSQKDGQDSHYGQQTKRKKQGLLGSSTCFGFRYTFEPPGGKHSERELRTE